MCLIRGQCFTHKHWIDPDTGQPLRCVVTAFRHGYIYYRPRYPDGTRGKSACFPEARWQEYVMIPKPADK